MFEGKAEGVDLAVAFVAGRVVAVLGQDFAHGSGAADIGVDGGNVVGRRRGRGAENVFKQPDPAGDRRSFDAVGADGEDAGLTEEASALCRVYGDTAELVAGGAIDGEGEAVETGEGAVDECVIGVEETDDAGVAVEEVAGAPAGSLAKILDETGDIGLAVEELLESERPIAGEAAASEERHAQVRSSAIASATGVLPVAGAGSAPTLRSLPDAFAAIRGASGQRRHDLLMQLFYGTSPIAAKYIVRMLSGDVQIGLRDGLLESAIAAAFGAEVSAVRWAMTLEGDAGRVALLAKRGALAEAKLRYFHPIPAMLAAPAASAADAMERLSEIAAGAIAAEDKYDGIRVQLHLHEGQVALFGRDANDITVAFPEIAAAAAQLSESLVLDGEIVAFEEGHPLPVSAVQSRLSGAETTLHERERTAVQFIAFDLVAHNDQLLIGTPLDRKSTRLNSSHRSLSRMPSSA